MPVQLPLYPEIPAYSYTVPLDGAMYTVHLTWWESRSSWYLQLDDADGATLVAGKRVVPYAPLLQGVQGGPPGLLTALGDEPYARDELTLIYVPEAELSQIPPVNEDDGRIVVIS